MSAGSSQFFYASSYLYIHLVKGLFINKSLAYVVAIRMIKQIVSGNKIEDPRSKVKIANYKLQIPNWGSGLLIWNL